MELWIVEQIESRQRRINDWGEFLDAIDSQRTNCFHESGISDFLLLLILCLGGLRS